MTTTYRSTNGSHRGVSLGTALLTGQAPDRGLYLPEQIPTFTPRQLDDLRDRPYAHVAAEVLLRYTTGLISEPSLRKLCDEIYDFDVPIERVGMGRQYLLRLDRGPTASFKDFAARMMGRLLGRLVREQRQELIILTATSGDTGSAVAQAFHGVEGVRVVVLFPVDEVSERQRKQMTTLGGNISTLAMRGKFDDCQALVKQAFADPALSGLPLSSANSINIGRLLPQSAYYVYAATRVAAPGEPVVFSVPSGNFGNLVGGLLAKRMGVPVDRFVVATNANDEVPVWLATGDYHKIEPSRECLSNAMNVGHPSNLARLIDLYGGQMDHTGLITKQPDADALRRDLWATSVDDDTTRATITKLWRDWRVLVEPHGAVGWAGLQRYLESPDAKQGLPCISLETAHPAKFPIPVQEQAGVDPELPASLQGLTLLQEHSTDMDIDYETFRTWLLDTHGARA